MAQAAPEVVEQPAAVEAADIGAGLGVTDFNEEEVVETPDEEL